MGAHPRRQRTAEAVLLGLLSLGVTACKDPGEPGNLVPATVEDDALLPRIEVNGTTLHADEIVIRAGYFAKQGLAMMGINMPGHGLYLDPGLEAVANVLFRGDFSWYYSVVGDVYMIENWAAFDDEAAWGEYRSALKNLKADAEWEGERISQEDWWDFVDTRIVTDTPVAVGFRR